MEPAFPQAHCFACPLKTQNEILNGPMRDRTYQRRTVQVLALFQGEQSCLLDPPMSVQTCMQDFCLIEQASPTSLLYCFHPVCIFQYQRCRASRCHSSCMQIVTLADCVKMQKFVTLSMDCYTLGLEAQQNTSHACQIRPACRLCLQVYPSGATTTMYRRLLGKPVKRQSGLCRRPKHYMAES